MPQDLTVAVLGPIPSTHGLPPVADRFGEQCCVLSTANRRTRQAPKALRGGCSGMTRP
jgi:hypothetical protein